MTTVVRFDVALDRAIEFARKNLALLGGEVVIVRDILGKIRFALNKAKPEHVQARLELATQLGAFGASVSELFMYREDLVAPEAIFQAAELRTLEPGIRLLERWVTGADWLRSPLDRSHHIESPAIRLTFFGIKGGVGRSTALVAVARHLAEKGDRVLVLDLDLESPGITASLLPEASRPSFGIVDWFVEDDVGQADDSLLREMIATSPLAAGTTGEIRVVPAAGSTGAETYVSKLSRIYASRPRTGDLATRLSQLLDRLEAFEQPQWVLLDSRAGIHDLAAIAVTRLNATSLLFAIDTPQTWLAYRFLFATWQRDPTLVRHFRDSLRVVAAQVPETERDAYLEHLRDHASELFADYLYDDAAADDVDAFNFDVSDRDAPHSPVPIYWRRELQSWDPTQDPPTVTAEQVRDAFSSLFQFVAELSP